MEHVLISNLLDGALRRAFGRGGGGGGGRRSLTCLLGEVGVGAGPSVCKSWGRRLAGRLALGGSDLIALGEGGHHLCREREKGRK